MPMYKNFNPLLHIKYAEYKIIVKTMLISKPSKTVK